MESIERWDKSLDQWDKQISIYTIIYIYLGKFDHDLTVLPNPGIMVYVREIIPFCGLNRFRSVTFFGNSPNISYHLKMGLSENVGYIFPMIASHLKTG